MSAERRRAMKQEDCRSCSRYMGLVDNGVCFGMVTPIDLETGEYAENQEVCDDYIKKEEGDEQDSV